MRTRFFIGSFAAFFVVFALFGVQWSVNEGPLRNPEEALKDFYEAEDRAEDQLIDPLILAGDRVVPLILKALPNKDMQKRRYAISFLGNAGNFQALPILEKILVDDTEEDYFRSDAFQAIYQISEIRAKELAPLYVSRSGKLGVVAKEILADKSNCFFYRSYWDAFWHVHF